MTTLLRAVRRGRQAAALAAFQRQMSVAGRRRTVRFEQHIQEVTFDSGAPASDIHGLVVVHAVAATVKQWAGPTDRPESLTLPTAPRFVDLCCGGGGATFGYEAAGMPCAAGVDNNARALQAFAANFPDAAPIDMDIVGELAETISKLRAHSPQVVVCSPECQPFSMAGLRDPVDKRVAVLFACLYIATRLKAKYIIIENVPAMRQHADGGTWRRCNQILARAGYDTHDMVLDAAHAVPQRRRRLFIIAYRDGTTIDFAAAEQRWASQRTHTLAQHFPAWQGCYYHPAVAASGRSLHPLSAPSPPLRTNCTRPSRGYVARAADAPFTASTHKVYPTVAEMMTIMGWPTHAYLPGSKRVAGEVLGNGVCPPVTAWLGGLIMSDWDGDGWKSSPATAATGRRADTAAASSARAARAATAAATRAQALAGVRQATVLAWKALAEQPTVAASAATATAAVGATATAPGTATAAADVLAAATTPIVTGTRSGEGTASATVIHSAAAAHSARQAAEAARRHATTADTAARAASRSAHLDLPAPRPLVPRTVTAAATCIVCALTADHATWRSCRTCGWMQCMRHGHGAADGHVHACAGPSGACGGMSAAELAAREARGTPVAKVEPPPMVVSAGVIAPARRSTLLAAVTRRKRQQGTQAWLAVRSERWQKRNGSTKRTETRRRNLRMRVAAAKIQRAYLDHIPVFMARRIKRWWRQVGKRQQRGHARNKPAGGDRAATQKEDTMDERPGRAQTGRPGDEYAIGATAQRHSRDGGLRVPRDKALRAWAHTHAKAQRVTTWAPPQQHAATQHLVAAVGPEGAGAQAPAWHRATIPAPPRDPPPPVAGTCQC